MLTAVTFSLFGFIIGIWADGFEKLQLVPLLIITPLTFLGGSFYSIDMLPPFWQKVALFNPVVYLISGFRWSFYGIADVSVGVSLAMTLRVPGRSASRSSPGFSGLDTDCGISVKGAPKDARLEGRQQHERMLILRDAASRLLRMRCARLRSSRMDNCLPTAAARPH